MAFSGALTLTDLNDYLGPSQACIKPVSGKDAPDDAAPSSDKPGGAGIEIAIDKDGAYYESAALASGSGATAITGEAKPRARTKLETAEISLNDCLACSGCVTSAESVLIGMQSIDELKRAVDEKRALAEANPDTRHLLVASISPQTLASLSAKCSLHLPSGSFIPSSFLLKRITAFLRSIYSFDYVLDTTFARHLSLLEHVAEFKERRKAQGEGKSGQLPMLASACPGWICYAEKTHGELLPLISKTKSPQQIAGVIAKDWIPRASAPASDALKNASTYHLAVMPCYDKKLEASRQDFYDELRRDKDVDCVLTTGELEGLMNEHGWDLLDGWDGDVNGRLHLGGDQADVKPPSPPASDVDVKLADSLSPPSALPDLGIPNAISHPGSSSGSYLFSLMASVWADYIASLGLGAGGAHQPQLEIKTIRNADYTEYVLRSLPASGGGEEGSAQPPTTTLFKAAQCYGFRNLQNLVRKVQKQGGVRGKRGAAGLLVGEDGQAVVGEGTRRGMVRGRGRGMVRRGRGGATPSASGSSTPTSTMGAADEEQERGYDYVEVMACPGGCVNGGGQLRPPMSGTGNAEEQTAGASSLIYRGTQEQTEAMLDSATATATAPVPDGWSTPKHSESGGEAGETDEPPVKGWQGTTKEWVRRVERAYWASDSVPASASLGREERGEQPDTDADVDVDAVRLPIASVHAAQALGMPIGSVSVHISDTLSSSSSSSSTSSSPFGTAKEVDELAHRVVQEVCKATGKERHALLRTEYHAVQDNEVSGLAVQW